jgi:hypothetical protein
LPLKERFFIQPLSPADAALRAKFSAQDILASKTLIDKKQWPYVQNALRNSAGYLRYDLNTVISSKPKEEKKSLKALTAKLFDSLNAVSSHFSRPFATWLSVPDCGIITLVMSCFNIISNFLLYNAA